MVNDMTSPCLMHPLTYNKLDYIQLTPLIDRICWAHPACATCLGDVLAATSMHHLYGTPRACKTYARLIVV